MAIELISTAIPKNKGNFPIVLSNDIKGGIHYTETIDDMNNIPESKLQLGMLCYVKGLKTYFSYLEQPVTDPSTGEITNERKWWPFLKGFTDSDISSDSGFFHTHDNKNVLDGITKEQINQWDNAVGEDVFNDDSLGSRNL